MSQVDLNKQEDGQSTQMNSQNQQGNYQDPLAGRQNQMENGHGPSSAADPKPDKKKMGGSDWIATIVSMLLVWLVGPVGALICFGGYWAVRSIVKSKMTTGLKVFLGVIVGLAFFVLLVVFVFFSAYISASIN